MNYPVSKLKDCCAIIAGQSPESKYYNFDGEGIPFFQGKADFGDLYPTIRVYCSQPTKIAEKDDILLSVRAPVGPTNLAPCQVCIGRGLTAIRPSSQLLTGYVLMFFRFFEAQLALKGTGTTFNAITQNVIKNLEIPIPPLDEQRRIVSRIEELFSELDNSVSTLQKTKEQLAVYRQAVLKEAFEGKFSLIWRKENPNESGFRDYDSISLKNVCFKDISGDENELKLEIPKTWRKTRLGEVFKVEVGGTPKRAKPEYWNGGINWVSSGEVHFNRICETEETISEDGLAHTSTAIHKPGTVMLAMIGEGKTRGQAAILDVPAAHNQNTAAILVSETLCEPLFVYYFLCNCSEPPALT